MGLVFYRAEHGAAGVDMVDDDDAKIILSRMGVSLMICILEDPATQFIDEQRVADTIEWFTAAGAGALPEQGWNVIQHDVWHEETDSDVMVYVFYRGTGALPLLKRPSSVINEPADQETGD